LLVLLGLWVGISGAGCSGRQKTAAGGAPEPSGLTYQAQVLHCVGAALPSSFLAERGADIDRARPLFEATRGEVLTVLGLFLGTGRWAGVPVRQGGLSGRPGSEEECRALGEISVGRTPGRWPTEGPLAVAGVISYAYLPIPPQPGGGTPAILARLAAARVSSAGRIEAAGQVEASAPYADVRLGYHERPPQDVARELTEKAADALQRALR
jgi:hypothetical protein